MTGGPCITEEVLLAFVDHRLQATEAEGVTRHVASCTECRQVLAELARDGDWGPSESGDAPLRRGDSIDRYVLEALLGSGGMGVVYSANDPALNRRVAIKLLKDSSQSERFEHEKRILASLEHPNIARLLDGGTTPSGRRYLVMEHVDGIGLSQYCAERQLKVSERLHLFRDVCTAVQYAHQKLVVHRDLKPSNILVTSAGVVKLLDFGIARLLESSDQALTATGTSAMTPAFASPEQVRREQLTTASDVYSLGVLLYELLTGVLPYRTPEGDLEALLTAVRDEEPLPPSATLARASDAQLRTRGGSRDRLKARLSGDVDSIVLKALRKEPQQRYATAEQLSEDLRRHLEGLPTTARRGTTTYRLGKFVGRHRAAVAATVATFTSLAAGSVATAWQARNADLARQRAERRFAEVRKLAHRVLSDYHDAAAQLPGSTALRHQLVKDALEYLDSLAKEAGDDASLQLELATAYLKVGAVQGDPFAPSLGDSAGALASYRHGLELARTQLAASPQRTEALRVVARAQLKLGDLQGVGGDLPAAVLAYREAIELNGSLTAADKATEEDRYELALDWLALGSVLAEQGKLDEAFEAHQTSLRLREAMVLARPDAKNRRAVATSHVTLGDVQCKRGRTAECLSEYELATTIYEVVVIDAPQYATDLGPMYQRLGLALQEAGQSRRAIEVQRKSVAVNGARVEADSEDSVALRMLAGSYSSLAQGLLDDGQIDEALDLYRKTLEMTRRLQSRDASNGQAKRDVALTLYELGRASLRAGDVEGAARAQHEGLALSEGLLTADPAGVVARSDVADHLVQLGRIKRRQKKEPQAVSDFLKAKELYEAVVKDAPGNATYEAGRAGVYAELARSARPGVPEACAWWTRAADAWAALEDGGMLPRDAASELAEARDLVSRCR